MEQHRLLKPASGLLLLTLGLPAAWAATPPDAGQTLQQLQSPPPPSAPATPAPTLQHETPQAEAAAGDQTLRVHITRLVFQGNTVYSAAVLEDVAHIANADVSLADLRAAVQRVSQYYRDHGYLLARAVLPAQDISAGVVTVQVLEGQLDNTTVSNHSQVSTRLIQSILAARLPANAPVDGDAANRALMLLQDTPGIGRVQGTLHPGAVFGATALDVDVSAAPAVTGSVGGDNYGSRFTGKNRLSGTLTAANLTGLGDQLSLQGVLSEHNGVNYGRIAWDLPVGYDGARAGAAWSRTHYELGQDFASLDAHGTARIAALYGSYPLLLAPTRHANIGLSLERRDFTDVTGALAFSNRKSARAAVLALSGDFADSALAGLPASSAWRLTGTLGTLDLDTPSTAALDAASARTAGHYAKAVLSLSREQLLIDKLSLYVAGTAQRSNKNLDSSEQFFLGGPNGIRAYPQGEAPGDQGWLGTVELRYGVVSHLQLIAFHDTGKMATNRHPYLAPPNGQHLSGSGVGFNTGWGPLSLKSSIAWRGGSDAPSSDTDKRPRLWLQGSYAF